MAVVHIDGVIVNGDGGSGETGADAVVSLLESLRDDDSISGVILQVDSPGGSVVASDEIAAAVRKVSDSGKPVVAWMREVAASGGYYVSANADRIVAHPQTMTGSIGVILELANVTGLADKVGYKEVVIKSGKLKDMGSPFRDLTAEERQVLQRLINEAYVSFVGTVAAGRDMSTSAVRKLADGRIYTGEQARALGLVDDLGDRTTAYDAMADELRVDSDSLDVVEYSRSSSLRDLFLGAASDLRPPSVSSIAQDVKASATPRLEYRAVL